MYSLLCITMGFAEPVPSRFELHSLEEKVRPVDVQKLDSEWNLTLADHKSILKEQWMALRRTNTLFPARPQVPGVSLVQGDELIGEVLRCSANELVIRLAPGPANPRVALLEVRVPRTALSMIRLKSFDGAESSPDSPLQEPRKTDVVRLSNGEWLRGTLLDFDTKLNELRLESTGKTTRIPFDRVVIIGMNSDLARARKPVLPSGRFVLKNGTRLTTSAMTIANQEVEVHWLFKQVIRFPLHELIALDFDHPKVTRLAELKPSQYQYRSFFGEKWDWAANRNLLGGQPSLSVQGGESYLDHVVAQHAESTISYHLQGKYRRFHAVVGLDASLGKRGSVKVLVLVDGKEYRVGDATELTISSGPRVVDIDVRSAKELTLAVQSGTSGNVQGHVNWGDAWLK